MLNKIKEILIRILYILILIYLIIFIPIFWGYKPLVVISGSKEPILKVGGILYYENYNINEFKEGDILVYKTKKHIISHRILKINNNNFITKGDANEKVDRKSVNYNQILGKGTNFSIPYIGYYGDYIYHHKYLLFISIIFIIIDYLFLYHSQNQSFCVKFRLNFDRLIHHMSLNLILSSI